MLRYAMKEERVYGGGEVLCRTSLSVGYILFGSSGMVGCNEEWKGFMRVVRLLGLRDVGDEGVYSCPRNEETVP
jgi:hypothetical protein